MTHPLNEVIADLDELLQYSTEFPHREQIVAALRAQQAGWISVDERLPDTPIKLSELKMPSGEVMGPQENSHDVLVCLQGGYVDFDRLIKAQGISVFYKHNNAVKFWQPKPNPPQPVAGG